MENMKTKKRILYIALQLFAKQGFDGVSVRDIAADVGVKESSLYKHYKSKQDIFEAMLFEMDERFKKAMDGLEQASVGDPNAPLTVRSAKERIEDLSALCTGVFYYFLNDEYAGSFRRVVTMEQFKNQVAAQMYAEHFFNIPLRLYANVFRIMLKRGEIPYQDADFLSLEFYAPIYMLLCRCDENTNLANVAASVIQEHVEAFGKQYCRT